MHFEGDFERDGAVCVRGAFDRDELALASEAIEAVLADPSPLALRASAPDDGAFIEDFCNWTRVQAMELFAHTATGAAIAAELTGSDTIRLFHDHLLVKERSTTQRTPWHQDMPYYNIDGRQAVSMWLPIDPVPMESTLECIAGSHRGTWYLPRTFLDEQAKWFPEGSLVEQPDFDAAPEKYPVVGWELEPGDAVFFHMLTVHGSGGVGETHRRRVISLRYLGDDVVHSPRPWRTSPPFPGLEHELASGVPLDHPLFPVLWRA